MKVLPPTLDYCLLQVRLYAGHVALAKDTVRQDIALVALAKWSHKAREAIARDDKPVHTSRFDVV